MNWFNTIKYPSKNFFFKKAKEEFTPEQIEIINNKIINHGYPPNWARDWVKSKLMSGKAPQEWISAISKCIVEWGFPPGWAESWAQSQLMSGKAPEEWISEIDRYIDTNGVPPDWAEEWVESKILSGQAPQDWISAINGYIINEYDSTWAQNWVKSGILDERIKMVIKGHFGFQKIRIEQIIDNYRDNR
jgi:hypothetical protein